MFSLLLILNTSPQHQQMARIYQPSYYAVCENIIDMGKWRKSLYDFLHKHKPTHWIIGWKTILIRKIFFSLDTMGNSVNVMEGKENYDERKFKWFS